MTYSPELSKTELYSQELARYTLRQFSAARSSLDQRHSAAISKLPVAFSRIAHADKIAAASIGTDSTQVKTS